MDGLCPKGVGYPGFGKGRLKRRLVPRLEEHQIFALALFFPFNQADAAILIQFLEQPDGLILAAAQQFHSVLQSEVNEHPVLDAICSGSS